MCRSVLAVSVALSALAGCARPVPPVVTAKPPEVTVALPIVRNVTDYEDFTGRTVASQTVPIKARVTGHLVKIHFADGAEVKEGEPLFDIDPLTYTAEHEKAKAAVVQAEAKITRLEREFKRTQDLLLTKAISPEEVDRITADLAEARATVKLAVRQVEAAKNYVDYAHVKAPISGRIGKRSIDRGTLVKADETLLTTIVSTDELYADFDIDDRTIMRLNELLAKGEIKSSQAGATAVKIGLPNRDDFSRDGTIIFRDNQVNPGTGTILIRAKMANADKLLDPGLFVRVRLNVGAEKRSLLVPEVAIGTDLGLKFVYVVNDRDEVESRRVRLGLLQDNLRVVVPLPDEPNSGVRETDRVIVKGIQRVREKTKVTPSFEKPPAASPGKVASVATGG